MPRIMAQLYSIAPTRGIRSSQQSDAIPMR
jgi:hypothetical protein